MLDVGMATADVLLVSLSRVWRCSNPGVDLLAGYLRLNGHNVDILYEHERKNQIASVIIEKIGNNYDLYGFSVYPSSLDTCVELSSLIKKRNPKAYIVFGGAFPTLYYKEILSLSDSIDAIILGDGEIPLCEYISFMGNKKFLNSKNIYTRNSNSQKIPFCNKKIEYLPAFDYYQNDIPERNAMKYHCMQTKNNVCTGACSFCIERKGRIEYKDIDIIVKEIEEVSRFGIKKIFFTDDNLLDPNDDKARERIYELCRRLGELREPVVYECYIRADTFVGSEDDFKLLRAMRDVGFVSMFVGLESGNMDDLILYNKKTTVKNNFDIFRILKSVDIFPVIGFINLNPYSTISTVQDNFLFLLDIEAANVFHYVCTFLNMYKYTNIYDKAKADGLLLPGITIKDRFTYKFYDVEVQEIADFLRNKMYDRIQSLGIEVDWLYQALIEYRYLRPTVDVSRIEQQLKKCKLRTLISVKDFFTNLYLNKNVGECERCVESFLSSIESMQKELLAIYNQVRIY